MAGGFPVMGLLESGEMEVLKPLKNVDRKSLLLRSEGDKRRQRQEEEVKMEVTVQI